MRNLRIREDTAKYLRNLDPNSAHYDPKTRSMRKNPYEHSGKAEDEVRFDIMNTVQGVPSARGLGFVGLNLKCSTDLLGQ